MVTGKVRATPESCVDSNMGYPHLIFMKFFFIGIWPILLTTRKGRLAIALRIYSLPKFSYFTD